MLRIGVAPRLLDRHIKPKETEIRLDLSAENRKLDLSLHLRFRLDLSDDRFLLRVSYAILVFKYMCLLCIDDRVWILLQQLSTHDEHQLLALRPFLIAMRAEMRKPRPFIKRLDVLVDIR